MKIRIQGYENDSIVDGPGIRFTIFTQGCPHKCVGCHNPETHDYNGGYEIEIEKLISIIDENPLLDGVSFSGGEPLLQAEKLYTLGLEIIKRGLNLIIYTGFLWEEIINNGEMKKLVEISDLVIDGKYMESEKSLDLKFKGSKNQRIINSKKSLKENKIIIEM